MAEACATCRFWRRDETHRDPEEDEGTCRRRAPILDDGGGGAAWLRTWGHDWCGEFERVGASGVDMEAWEALMRSGPDPIDEVIS